MSRALFQFINKRRKFFIFGLGNGAIQALTLTANIFIVRKLSLEEYGVFSVITMIMGFAITFGFSWSSSSILYYGSKEKAADSTMVKTIWARNILYIASLTIIFIVFIVFRGSINRYIGQDVSLIILVWIFAKSLQDFLYYYLLAAQKQIPALMQIVISKLLLLILLVFFRFDLRILISFGIISDLTSLLFIIKINRNDFTSFVFNRELFREILRFSLWQLFGFSGVYIIQFGDIAVIKYFMTIEDIAVYNAAYKLFAGVSGLAFVITSFFGASVSALVQAKDVQKLKRFFYRERYVIVFLIFLAHVVLLLSSRQIILLFYGPEYQTSILIFNILLLGSLIRYPSVFYTLYYNTNRKYKVLQYVNIGRSLINIVLDVVLIRYVGIIGPAIATVIAVLIAYLYHFFYCEKRIAKLCHVG